MASSGLGVTNAEGKQAFEDIGGLAATAFLESLSEVQHLGPFQNQN